MYKTLISLMLLLFFGTAAAVVLIYSIAQKEQNIRLWETNRLRGYECLYEHQYNAASRYFRKAGEASKKIGKSDYRYAVSLEDAASLSGRKNEWDKADKLTRKAIEIFDKKASLSTKQGTLFWEDKLLAACRLSEYELSGKKRTDEVWQEFSQISSALLNAGTAKIDPFVLRKVSMTMISIADACAKEGKYDLQKAICSDVFELSQKFTAINDLSKGTQKRMHVMCAGGQSWEALLETVPALIKAYNYEQAGENLQQAHSLAISEKGELPLEVEIMEARFNICKENFEDAENLLQRVLSRKTLSDETRDDCLNKLLIIYRQCGEKERAAEVLRRQWELRKALHGVSNSKTMETELDYASELQLLGQLEKARPICLHIVKTMQTNEFVVVRNEQLAAALLRIGNTKLAKEILDEVVEQFFAEKKKKQILPAISSFFDYAVMELSQNNRVKAEAAMQQGLAIDEGKIASYNQVMLGDSLADWANFLRDKKGADLFIRNAILIMPVPVLRKEALRETAALAVLEHMRASHPAAFSSEVTKHLAKIQAGIKKFAPAKFKEFLSN